MAFDTAPPPPVKDLLEPDETVINPFYMRQLLEYGIKLGVSQGGDMDPESLLREAEVCHFLLSLVAIVFTVFIAPCSRAKRHQLNHVYVTETLFPLIIHRSFFPWHSQIASSYLCKCRNF